MTGAPAALRLSSCIQQIQKRLAHARARVFFCAAAHTDGLINYNQPIISHAELVFCLQFGEKKKRDCFDKTLCSKGCMLKITQAENFDKFAAISS